MYPRKYDEVKKSMDSLLHNVVYNEHIFEPSVAYTNARTDEMSGTIYRLFVNNRDVDFSRFLYMHECGHILFGHVKNMDERMNRFLLAKISMAYNRISRHFPNYSTYLKIFRTVLFNVVMDFEVNSRLFSEEEWKYMNKSLENLTHKKGVNGMWPTDYGYDIGLTWNEYLNLILLDPDKFFEKFRINYLDSSNRNRQIVNIPVKLNEDELKRLREMEEKHENGTFLDKSEQKRIGDRSSSATEKVMPSNVVKYKSMDSLFKQILQVLDIKELRTAKRDMFYNHNRRKYGSNIIIPKVKNEEVRVPANLIILMDVSGSVELELITSFLKIFRSFQKIYKSTKFIAWNTNRVGEWDINQDINFSFGGGTDIGKGISYINKKYQPKSKDVVFVISDFLDNLEDWKNELNKIRSKKYAINWYNISQMNPGFEKVFQYAG